MVRKATLTLGIIFLLAGLAWAAHAVDATFRALKATTVTTSGSTSSATFNSHVVVNNVNATAGQNDLEIKLDPNNDSLITLDTGGAGTNVGWGLQATSEGSGHFAEFELVSALWEPFFCWGAGAGTAYNGTCGYQAPSTQEPFHFIRATDTSPTNNVIQVETQAIGTPLWGVDAVGAEHFYGTTSGNITMQPQAVGGTYNFNLPITAGTAGQFLTSQAGGATAMTWTSPPAHGMQLFTASGTFTVPANVTWFKAECWGGGGGGGGYGAGFTTGGTGGNTEIGTVCSSPGGLGGIGAAAGSNNLGGNGGGAPTNGTLKLNGTVGFAGNQIYGVFGGGGRGAIAPRSGDPETSFTSDAWGGGGDGGGNSALSGGGGGGSGAYSEGQATTTPTTGFTVIIGAAGAGGTGGNQNGTAGQVGAVLVTW